MPWTYTKHDVHVEPHLFGRFLLKFWHIINKLWILQSDHTVFFFLRNLWKVLKDNNGIQSHSRCYSRSFRDIPGYFRCYSETFRVIPDVIPRHFGTFRDIPGHSAFYYIPSKITQKETIIFVLPALTNQNDFYQG